MICSVIQLGSKMCNDLNFCFLMTFLLSSNDNGWITRAVATKRWRIVCSLKMHQSRSYVHIFHYHSVYRSCSCLNSQPEGATIKQCILIYYLLCLQPISKTNKMDIILTVNRVMKRIHLHFSTETTHCIYYVISSSVHCKRFRFAILRL